MYKKNQELLNLIEPEVAMLGYELTGIELGKNSLGSVLRIYIEKEEGVTVDDCALVSRQLTGVLDVEDSIKGRYHLEVSSPGLDRPLFTVEQCKRFIGKTVQLSLYEKRDNRKRFIGVLTEVNGNEIILNLDNQEMTFPFDAIAMARLVPQF